MDTLQKLEAAVACLSKDDLARFRTWLDEYEAEVWDRQFEEDVTAGRLDRLREEALAESEAGNLLVIDRPFEGEVPDHRDLRDERVDEMAGRDE